MIGTPCLVQVGERELLEGTVFYVHGPYVSVQVPGNLISTTRDKVFLATEITEHSVTYENGAVIVSGETTVEPSNGLES